jgi:hypothetical protein
LIGETHEDEKRDDDEKNQKRIPARRRKDDVCDQPPQHQELPVGDVQNVCDAEDEGESEGGQRIRAALEHSREN